MQMQLDELQRLAKDIKHKLELYSRWLQGRQNE